MQIQRGCELPEQWGTGCGAVEYCLELGSGYPSSCGQVADAEFPEVRQPRQDYTEACMSCHVASVVR